MGCGISKRGGARVTGPSGKRGRNSYTAVGASHKLADDMVELDAEDIKEAEEAKEGKETKETKEAKEREEQKAQQDGKKQTQKQDPGKESKSSPTCDA